MRYGVFLSLLWNIIIPINATLKFALKGSQICILWRSEYTCATDNLHLNADRYPITAADEPSSFDFNIEGKFYKKMFTIELK